MTENLLKKLVPDNIEVFQFGHTKFQNYETERVAEAIMATQYGLNPHGWSPFTIDDIERYAHPTMLALTDNMPKVLYVLTKGGHPSFGCTTVLEPGYLIQGEDKKYSVTSKFLDAILKLEN